VPLHSELDKKLSRLYEPKATINNMFKGYDITFITKEHGEPMQLGLMAIIWAIRTMRKK